MQIGRRPKRWPPHLPLGAKSPSFGDKSQNHLHLPLIMSHMADAESPMSILIQFSISNILERLLIKSIIKAEA